MRLAPHLVPIEPLLFPIYGTPFVSKAFYDAGLTLYDILGARHDGGWHRRLSKAATLEHRADPAPGRSARRPALPRRGRGRRAVHAGRGHGPRSPPARRSSPGSGRPGVRTDGDRRDRRATAPRTSRRAAQFEIPTRAVVDATGVWAAEPDHPFGGRLDADPAEPRRAPRRASRAHPEHGRADDPRPGQDRVPRAVARSLADRHDRRAVRRPGRPAVRRRLGGRPPARDGQRDDGRRARHEPTSSGPTRGCGRSSRRPDGSTVKASREHRVTVEADGVVRIGGGKYTTYRVMARDVIDAVLGRAAAKSRPSETAERRLIGAADDRRAGPDRRRARHDPGRRRGRHPMPRRDSWPATGPRRPRSSRLAPSSTCCARWWPVGRSSRRRSRGRSDTSSPVSVDDVLAASDAAGPELPDRGAAIAPRVARDPRPTTSAGATRARRSRSMPTSPRRPARVLGRASRCRGSGGGGGATSVG